MNGFLIFGLLVALALSGVSCSRGSGPAANVRVGIVVSPSPPAVGTATIDVALSTRQGVPITGAQLLVRGDMNMAGMEPVFATLVGQGNGHYVARAFHFSMAGDWIVSVHGTLSGGQPVAGQVDVNGVTPQPQQQEAS